MTELLSVAQKETDDDADCEEPVFQMLRTVYPQASVYLRTTKATHLDVQGREPIELCDLEDGVWEDTDYIDNFIEHGNHQELPTNRVVRVIAAPCDSISGPSLLAVASKDFRLVFDDVDLWFIQTCATMISQMWNKRLLAEVMRAKEKFLRGVSHQLRTPIHGILGSVDLLAEELRSRRAILEAATSAATSAVGGPSVYLDTIKTSGRDLISIVNSMITLNRWADIAMSERFYTTRTVGELEAELAGEVQKVISGDIRYRASVCFHYTLQSKSDSLRTDHSLLRDSLLPLLMNAIQNTPRGIVKVTISLLADSQELVVDIEDNGCGIRSDDHKRIFEPYEKVIEHSTGAGLGLTLASKFAALLNGTVTLVSSDVGLGSHFRAVFRELECVPSSGKVEPIKACHLSNLPSRFHVMTLDAGHISLCKHLTECLLERGFVAVEEPAEDSFVIADFEPDLEERRSFLSRVPQQTVSICLIPASEGEAPLHQVPKNVVYVKGPHFTATLDAALSEANDLSGAIQAVKAQIHPQAEMGSRENPCHHTADDMTSLSKPCPSEEPHAFPNAEDREANGAVVVASAAFESAVTPVEPRIVVPILNTTGRTLKPMALIVDDNLINLRIMQMYCRKRGLPFLCATDGSQAVEIFTAHQTLAAANNTEGQTPSSVAIQLILMDLQMPVCDGIQATKRIRQLEEENRWPRSSLFIVTGQDNPTDRSAAENVGADEYFVKPVGVKVLDRGVKRYFPEFHEDS